MTATDRPVIGVIGVGYVGLVTAVCFAELGHNVVCRDIDPGKVENLQNGVIPIYEPGLADLVAKNRSRLTFTTDMQEAVTKSDLLFISVPTPSTYSGDADLSYVEGVIDEVSRTDANDRGLVLVMKSTVPVGTGRRMIEILRARGLDNVGYVSNPEFLQEGCAIQGFMHPDRVVVGGDDERCIDLVASIHRPLECSVIRTNVSTAEMIKYASNAFLATKISFINEIANVCEETGADVTQVAEGMGLDRRIGSHFLHAGIGYGGSCFPKDVAALKQLAGNSGYHFQLLNAVIEVNELQKRRLIGKLFKNLGSLRGKTVTLLGLAFKPGTDDMREAVSLVLSSRLLSEGAKVRGYDPVAGDRAREVLGGVEVYDEIMDAVRGSDALVIVTEWPQFMELHLPELANAMNNPLLVDGRNMFSPAAAEEAGFIYEGVGRGVEQRFSSVESASTPITNA